MILINKTNPYEQRRVFFLCIVGFEEGLAKLRTGMAATSAIAVFV